MRTFLSLLALGLLLSTTNPASAQEKARHFDVEVEPVAYLFNGAGLQVGHQVNTWSYTVEVFRLTVPSSLHGNEGFEASPLGIELHAERFFGPPTRGFHAGPEVGISRLEVTHIASGKNERRLRYSIGIRSGYRWYPGLGDLYLNPVIGLGYTLNAGAIEIENETFEGGAMTPWGTVGLGWSF